MQCRLPAEWEPQSGILLAWPHATTDWADCLDKVETVYTELVEAITRFQTCVIASPEPEIVRNHLKTAGININRIRFYAIPTNDTWARDFGPITIVEKQRPILLDFGFNGWGDKFPSNLDNQVTRLLYEAGAFGDIECRTINMILEGGSIESDGNGTLLTTVECLINPNRNPLLDKGAVEQQLKEQLGAEKILWLKNGYLAGDDTDSHIDTLARFCPQDTIIYQACDDMDDEHFSSLELMRTELQEFATKASSPYRLIALPWPQAQYAGDRRLPATYANFLIINDAVLVPTYNDPNDAKALDAIAAAFPGRESIGIDCSTLIRQNGSLHCITMQLPEGVTI